MGNETTDQNFTDFKTYVRNFLTHFGLHDWHVRFVHEDIPQTMAECRSSQQSHSCIFALAKDWETVLPTHAELRRVAFHEVWELLTAEMEVVARADFELSPAGRKEVLERARHTLIRRMENCVLKHLPV